MEIILNDYHKKVNAKKKAKVEYWKTHPIPREEALRKIKIVAGTTVSQPREKTK